MVMYDAKSVSLVGARELAVELDFLIHSGLFSGMFTTSAGGTKASLAASATVDMMRKHKLQTEWRCSTAKCFWKR